MSYMKSEAMMYEFIKEKEIENIILEHGINRKKIENKSKDLIKHGFEQISSRILLQIKLYIENSNKFKLAERSYEKRIRLRDQYVQYIDVGYAEESISEDDIGVIKGIYQLVRQEIDNFPESSDNPMEYERMLIISTGLLKIKEYLNTIQDELITRFELPKGLNIDFSQHLQQFIISYYQEIKTELIRIVTTVVEQLNNPDQREEIHRFLKFLAKQETMLKNFIHFNFEIDQEWQANHGNIEMNQVYIYPLRQLYQEIHTTIMDINHDFNKKTVINSIEIKNIESIVETNVVKNRRMKELIELIEDDKTNTIDRLLSHVTDEMRKIAAIELRSLKKASESTELTSYMIVDLFAKTIHSITQKDISLLDETTETKIFQAVMTTLQFKYQALKEKDSDFHMKKLDFYLECENDYYEYRDVFEKSMQQLADDVLQGSKDSFVTIQEKFNRIIRTNDEKNKQIDIEYCSKEILFEMRTFEDLMLQSVSKLKESKNAIVASCTQEIATLYSKLIEGLDKLGIKQFIPVIGESFNGKMHEVLMVEVTNEYKKGDIIRVQNGGFLLNEQVLLRASVIVEK